MPTGQLRKGYDRVAGVVKVEVKAALLQLKDDMDLRSLSQAVGVALEEWMTIRNGVYNSQATRPRTRTPGNSPRVLDPPAERGGDADE